MSHDDVIKWKHFPDYWPFVRGIHRWPVNSPHKGQWRGALMFPLICAWINGGANNREACDLRRHGAHYDVTVMKFPLFNITCCTCPWESWMSFQFMPWILVIENYILNLPCILCGITRGAPHCLTMNEYRNCTYHLIFNQATHLMHLSACS